ncbi:MarR family winged helix-turn-helix transcriptional regulator [Saccharopolyspora mangrovi]|uniref:MarR family transcriptional regulator n=1 Tax=Saccharopolyspora mangrovi TaxID=3082379 RepID=A0ABU6A824_9PSEU|nr:MarR family transcriptional regulator [Saccharopolyspora sp. S2-29]MEB3367717.1 MarR family transcriptional regulator [Saccharopolyspora sp. S2-29]
MDAIGTGLDSLGYRFNMIARMARANFEQRLGEAGASFTTWTILESLTVHGPMIQRDLAGSLHVSGQTLARQVDRLVETGWLERGEAERDRRTVRLHLTDEGRAAHRRLQQASREANEQLVAGLSSPEVDQLNDLLARLARNFE